MNLIDGKNRKVLFLVPHPDDEINLAGGLLKLLVEKNWEVFCVVLTMGDYYGVTTKRIIEYQESLKILGVDKRHALYLGYPECDESMVDLMINNPDIIVSSKQGIRETYGLREQPEFCYYKNRKHKEFSLKSIIGDIGDILKEIVPSVVFYSNRDNHPIHQLLAVAYEMAESQLENNIPTVYTGFCYSTSWTAPRDFYGINLKKTVIKENENINNYDWSKRIRFPVDVASSRNILSKNLTYKALKKHHTQLAVSNAKSVINSDKIFWIRNIRNEQTIDFIKLIDIQENFVYSYWMKEDIDLNSFSCYICYAGEIHIMPLTSTNIELYVNNKKIIMTKNIKLDRKKNYYVKIVWKKDEEVLSDEVFFERTSWCKIIGYAITSNVENFVQSIWTRLLRKIKK